MSPLYARPRPPEHDVGRAYRYAVRHHDWQRYGPYFYGHHLRQTIQSAKELGFSDDIYLVVSALHDVVEDTAVTACDLTREFGPQVARAVQELTRSPSVSHADYIRGLSPLAFAVKLADRLANLRALGCYPDQIDRDRHRRLPKYQGEMPALRQRALQLGASFMEAVARVEKALTDAARRIARHSRPPGGAPDTFMRHARPHEAAWALPA